MLLLQASLHDAINAQFLQFEAEHAAAKAAKQAAEAAKDLFVAIVGITA